MTSQAGATISGLATKETLPEPTSKSEKPGMASISHARRKLRASWSSRGRLNVPIPSLESFTSKTAFESILTGLPETFESATTL